MFFKYLIQYCLDNVVILGSMVLRRLPLSLTAALLSLSCLCRQISAVTFDTWDIEVRLYRDPNCFDRADQLLLLDQACYSNIYSNNTKAYQLRVVNFNPPQVIQWMEYTDDCVTKAMPMPRTILAGRCEKWAGPFWGLLKLRFRSRVCMGADCSQLTTINQVFYAQKDCQGHPSTKFTYPVPGCMRGYNGTQELTTNESGKFITHTIYDMNDMCDRNILDMYEYVIESGRCYPLYEDKVPYSFKWEVDETATLVTGSARSRHHCLSALLSSLSLVLFLVRWLH